MAKYEIDLSSTNINKADIEDWFTRNRFTKIEFSGKKEFLSTFYKGETVGFKIKKIEGFDTFYKESSGGTMLIFEYKIANNKLFYNCYAPLWLFGIWTKKIEFKEETNKRSLHLQEGFKIRQAFESWIGKQKRNK